MTLQRPPICMKEIRQNIFNVKNDLPLTQPLSLLNYYCEFKKEWEESYNAEYGDPIKAKKKEYRNRPEIKAKMKEYHNRSEIKAKMKEYRNRPEIKAKMKEYRKEYYKNKRARRN